LPAKDGTRRTETDGHTPPRRPSAKWLVGSGLLGITLGAFLTTRRAARALNSRAKVRSAPPANGDATTEQVLQRLTRVRTVDGHEAISGTLLAEFAPGERNATLHVAFCPPFETLPNLEAQIADDSEASVKVTQVLHNGAQLEVRLPEPADETIAVEVEFFATDAEAI